MKTVCKFVLAALLAMVPAIASANPIYAAGNTCPTDTQYNAVGAPYTTQYTVNDAIACVFDPDSPNIQGDSAEAAFYLGALAGWTGFLQDGPGAGDIAGFTYTGTTGGEFIINPLLVGGGGFNQFAVGVKDGHNPKWAIFLLSVGDFQSAWSMTEGSLSHFTLYGRTRLTGEPQCAPPLVCEPGGDDPPTVPDGGATIAMLGAAMFGLGYARRKLAQ